MLKISRDLMPSYPENSSSNNISSCCEKDVTKNCFKMQKRLFLENDGNFEKWRKHRLFVSDSFR